MMQNFGTRQKIRISMSVIAANIIQREWTGFLARRFLNAYRRGTMIIFPHSANFNVVKIFYDDFEPVEMRWSTILQSHWWEAPHVPGQHKFYFHWLGQRLATDMYPTLRTGAHFVNVFQIPERFDESMVSESTTVPTTDRASSRSMSTSLSSSTFSRHDEPPTLAKMPDVLPPALMSDREKQAEEDESLQSHSSLLANRHADFFRPLHLGNTKSLRMPKANQLTRSSDSIHDFSLCLRQSTERAIPRILSSTSVLISAEKPPPLRRRRHSLGTELSRSTEIRPKEYFSRHLPVVESYCILPTSSRAPCVWPPVVLAHLSGFQDAASRLRLFSILQAVQLRKPHICDFIKCQFGSFTAPSKSKKRLQLLGGACNIPKPGSLYGGGEDSYFVSDPSLSAAGVADGVGEFRDYGINSRDYSQSLMDFSLEYLKAHPYSEHEGRRMSRHLRNALNHASRKIREYPDKLGASTAVLVALESSCSTLGIASLGDSTVMHFRRDAENCVRMKNIFRVSEQQHTFNCPFQLSSLPSVDQMRETITRLDSSPEADPRIRANYMTLLQSTSAGQIPTPDSPMQAQLYDIPVVEGDLILLMSDGVSDNLFVPELQELLSHTISPYEGRLIIDATSACCGKTLFDGWKNGWFTHLSSVIRPPRTTMYTDPEGVAKGIAMAAVTRFWDSRAFVPFGEEAQKQFRNAKLSDLLGGKTDDTTVVALWVTSKR